MRDTVTSDRPPAQELQALALGAPAQDGAAMRRILGLVKRRSYIVVLLAVAGVALGVKIQHSMTPTYTSSASILIDPKRPDTLGSASEFINLSVDNAKVSGVVSMLESSSLLAKVVARENLADDPEFGTAGALPFKRWLTLIPYLKDRLQPAPDTPDDRAERAEARLEKAIKVYRDGPTYIIRLDATASNPALAQRIARGVVDAYLDDQAGTKYEAAHSDSVWLTARLNNLRGELIRSEKAVQDIRQKYHLNTTGQGPDVTVDRQAMTELGTKLVQAQAEAAAAKARFEQADKVKRTGGNLDGLPDVANSKIIIDLRSQQATANRMLASLSRQYTADFPARVAAENDVRVIENQIAVEVGRIVDNLRNEYQTAEANRQALKDQLAGLVASDSSDTLADGRVELQEAMSNAAANRGLYEADLVRLRELEEQQTRPTVEARVISPATAPTVPSGPKLVMFAGGGGGIGFLIGAILAFGPALMERGFGSAGDAESKLLLPVISAVPLLRRRDLTLGRRRLNIVDYTAIKSLSRFAESLRKVRVYLRLADAGSGRVVQLTSAVPGEGKSTLAACLAISAARAGIRTVLVDVDVRKSSVYGLLGLEVQEGLVDIVEGTSSVGTAVQRYQQLPLSIIGAGSFDIPKPDVVGSQRFRALVQSLARDHDLVILDCPPVLAVSDALAIADVVDVTLLVVEWRKTARGLVEQAVKLLREAQAPLAGVVVNRVDFAQLHKYDERYQGMGKYNRTMRDYYSD